ncbi:HEAT repeat domain-containing protein, partial [Moorena sp. SIO3H5]|uniref:HEAT repeat domain-containing protein n=1 Tax=Moorena sp. SIO3H5 TaxID=2607834 RepID=UPI0025FB3AA9
MPHRGHANHPKLFPTVKTGVTQCLCYLLALLVAVLLIVNGSHAHNTYPHESHPEPELWQLKGIVAALDDPDPEVWVKAFEKLSNYKLDQLKPPLEIPKETIDKIADLLSYENQDKSIQSIVRGSALKALGQMGAAASESAPQILPLLTHSDSDVRFNASSTLGEMGAAAKDYAPQIAKLLTDSDTNVRDSVASALESMGAAKDYAPQIAKLLTDSDSDVRGRAASTLGQMGAAASEYAPQIAKLLTDSEID